MSAVQAWSQRYQDFREGTGTFESLGLSANVCHAIKKNGCTPTYSSAKMITFILSGIDVVVKLTPENEDVRIPAFLAAMLEKLKQRAPEVGVRALILSPTRDLARQTFEYAQKLVGFTDLLMVLLVSGGSLESLLQELAHNPDIIVATPDMLKLLHLDILLRTVEYIVLDEADDLASMGFAEKLDQILRQLREDRQLLVFTKSLNKSKFVKAHLRPGFRSVLTRAYVRVIREDRLRKMTLTLSSLDLRQEEKQETKRLQDPSGQKKKRAAHEEVINSAHHHRSRNSSEERSKNISS